MLICESDAASAAAFANFGADDRRPRILQSMEGRRANPSFEGSWIDEAGQTWRRKGRRGHVLEARRIRSLLRGDDVPLVVWRSFETSVYDDVTAKLEAADALWATADDDDVRASEWEAKDGRRLLMLEHLC